MYSLGFGGSTHDYSVCLLKDGEIVCAIEEERITRKKYGYGIDARVNKAVDYVLRSEGISENQIDCFGSNDILNQDYYFKYINKTKIYNHHLSHAASSYYPSGFDEAAILVIDHSGSVFPYGEKLFTETVSYYMAQGKNITCLQKVKGESKLNNGHGPAKQPSNSIGYLYSMCAKLLGCTSLCSDKKIHSESGKLMGLSSYGKPIYLNELSKYNYVINGMVKISIDETRRFIEKSLKESTNYSMTKENIAASIQKLVENLVVECANHLYSLFKCDNICIAGGVGLNGLINMSIIKNTKFKNIFIQPASNDAGTSIGSAYLAYYEENNNYEPLKVNNNFFGREYSEDEILLALKAHNERITWERDTNIMYTTSKLLAEDNIIAWYQGRSEFGPRSLGNRSILANPANPKMKDILNSRVKFRESYRPYAPSVLYEYQEKYFDIQMQSNYMLLIPQANPITQKKAPAIVHVDNTARMQSVSKSFNYKFYMLITEFYKISNIPILLNTSMNVMGEPICETPEDAIQCLLKSNIDYLVIEDYIITKKSKYEIFA